MAPTVTLPLLLSTLLTAYIVLKLSTIIYNLFLHPLAKFPGPLAGRATDWYKTYIEVYRQQSMVHLLIDLHEIYGDVVRIAPNEVGDFLFFPLYAFSISVLELHFQK
jgi:hypothetical protein